MTSPAATFRYNPLVAHRLDELTRQARAARQADVTHVPVVHLRQMRNGDWWATETDASCTTLVNLPGRWATLAAALPTLRAAQLRGCRVETTATAAQLAAAAVEARADRAALLPALTGLAAG